MTLLFALSNLGRVDQGVLGKRHVLERSTVSRGINVLHKKGYVGKSDEYRPEVFLTAKGADLVERLIPLWEELMDKLTSDMGKEGMEMISKLEQKLM